MVKSDESAFVFNIPKLNTNGHITHLRLLQPRFQCRSLGQKMLFRSLLTTLSNKIP